MDIHLYEGYKHKYSEDQCHDKQWKIQSHATVINENAEDCVSLVLHISLKNE